MSTSLLALFGLPGGSEWIVIGIVALLLFGRRLPDVARSMGRSIVEFKKGLRDVKDQMTGDDKDDDDHNDQRNQNRVLSNDKSDTDRPRTLDAPKSDDSKDRVESHID